MSRQEELIPKPTMCWECLRRSPNVGPRFDHPVRVRYSSGGRVGLRSFCDEHADLAPEFVAGVRNDPSGALLEVVGLPVDERPLLRLVGS